MKRSDGEEYCCAASLCGLIDSIPIMEYDYWLG
jgi:hypothetical protein